MPLLSQPIHWVSRRSYSKAITEPKPTIAQPLLNVHSSIKFIYIMS